MAEPVLSVPEESISNRAIIGLSATMISSSQFLYDFFRPEADIRRMSASLSSVKVQIVQWAGGLPCGLLDMRVDHRRLEVAVTE